MLHYSVNRPLGALLGEGDLATMIPWLLRYSRMLEDRVRFHWATRAFLWFVKVPTHLVHAKQEQYREPPEAGSIVVTDDAEEWEPKAPRLNAADAAPDLEAVRRMVFTGSGFPPHWYGEPGSNRAEASAMQAPAERHLRRRQQYFVWLLEDLVYHAYNRARESAPSCRRCPTPPTTSSSPPPSPTSAGRTTPTAPWPPPGSPPSGTPSSSTRLPRAAASPSCCWARYSASWASPSGELAALVGDLRRHRARGIPAPDVGVSLDAFMVFDRAVEPPVARELTAVMSVDIVFRPAADGRILAEEEGVRSYELQVTEGMERGHLGRRGAAKEAGRMPALRGGGAERVVVSLVGARHQERRAGQMGMKM
jgi:hypothetical protein